MYKQNLPSDKNLITSKTPSDPQATTISWSNHCMEYIFESIILYVQECIHSFLVSM